MDGWMKRWTDGQMDGHTNGQSVVEIYFFHQVCCCCCWSLLHSAILRSQADSLHLHMILHEWLAFYSTLLNIHRSGVLTAMAWPVPHETATILVRSVYTIQPCTTSLHAKPHMSCACVFSCNLPPALLAEWPGSFMCYCGNTGVEWIPKRLRENLRLVHFQINQPSVLVILLVSWCFEPSQPQRDISGLTTNLGLSPSYL